MNVATSNALWRTLIVVLALFTVASVAIDTASLPRVMKLGIRGEPLVDAMHYADRGPTTMMVDSLSTDSPLRSAGVVPGDRIRFDDPLGYWQSRIAGDVVALTVIRDGSARRIEVTVPPARSLPPFSWAIQGLALATAVASLLIGVVVGWRRPNSIAMRGLAATSVIAPAGYSYAAAQAWHFLPIDFFGSVASLLPFATIVFFALHFPDDRPAGLRLRLARVYPWIFGLFVVAVVSWTGLLYAGHYEPFARYAVRVGVAVTALLFFGALVLGSREAEGEAKLRFRWMLGTVGVIVGTGVAFNVNFWLGTPIPQHWLLLAMNVATMLGIAGLVYAVFRHRVMDFGFALNRALVYGIASAILLLTFFGLEKLAEHYVHVEGREQNAMIDGGIALGVFLFFHRVRHWVEHHLERIFFSGWHRSEAKLRQFIAQAEHITTVDALAAAFTAEIGRFTGGAGNATYRRGAEGQYDRIDGTLRAAPSRIDADEPVVVALRADRKPARINDTRSTLPALLALPMMRRSTLDGFVLLESKSHGEPYRPDEIELLEFAVNQAGRDLHSLEAAEREQQATMLRAANEELRSIVEIAIVGRKAEAAD